MRHLIRRKRIKNKKFKLILCAVALCFCVFYIDRTMSIVMDRALSNRKHNMATELLNTAVVHVLQQNTVQMDQLIQINYNDDNSVSTIETNTMAVNTLRTMFTNAVLQELNTMDVQTLNLPIGSLSDIQLFQGRGPGIHFKFYPGGYMTAKIISEFHDAGINQTRHRLMLEISAEINCVGMLRSQVATAQTEYMISETIIVGKIPASYSNILFEDRSLIDRLNPSD